MNTFKAFGSFILAILGIVKTLIIAALIFIVALLFVAIIAPLSPLLLTIYFLFSSEKEPEIKQKHFKVKPINEFKYE